MNTYVLFLSREMKNGLCMWFLARALSSEFGLTHDYMPYIVSIGYNQYVSQSKKKGFVWVLCVPQYINIALLNLVGYLNECRDITC